MDKDRTDPAAAQVSRPSTHGRPESQVQTMDVVLLKGRQDRSTWHASRMPRPNAKFRRRLPKLRQTRREANLQTTVPSQIYIPSHSSIVTGGTLGHSVTRSHIDDHAHSLTRSHIDDHARSLARPHTWMITTGAPAPPEQRTGGARATRSTTATAASRRRQAAPPSSWSAASGWWSAGRTG